MRDKGHIKGRRLRRLALLAGLWALPAFAQINPAARWQGQYFDQREGGIYLKAKTQGFSGAVSSTVQIVLYHILSQKAYEVSYSLGASDGMPREEWRLPSGKYRVAAVLLVDGSGHRRLWKDGEGGRRSLIVGRQCLSNLGLWTLSPQGTDKLAITFAMIPNSYREEGPKAESSVAAVLDGYTGLIQTVFAGKKLIQGAGRNQSTDSQLRDTYTVSRSIAMFYRLDLFRDNNHAREIAAVLAASDPDLRECYTDRLAALPNLHGSLKFTFILSKDTKSIRRIKSTGGQITDAKLIECLSLKLEGMNFPVANNMIGELTYTFDVK